MVTNNKAWLLLPLLLLLHPFNSLFSRTTWVSRHQRGKPFWILLKQEMMGWQWHQLDHMKITCISLQTDNHTSTSPVRFYRPDALPPTQPTASKHWRQLMIIIFISWYGWMVMLLIVMHCDMDSNLGTRVMSSDVIMACTVVQAVVCIYLTSVFLIKICTHLLFHLN